LGGIGEYRGCVHQREDQKWKKAKGQAKRRGLRAKSLARAAIA
jgi:hypothetical protein